jgi:hypothetical protein
MKLTILEKRMKSVTDQIRIVQVLHCKSKHKIEDLKSEVEHLQSDRKLLVQQLMQTQDEVSNMIEIKISKTADKSLDRLELLESLSNALLEL